MTDLLELLLEMAEDREEEVPQALGRRPGGGRTPEEKSPGSAAEAPPLPPAGAGEQTPGPDRAGRAVRVRGEAGGRSPREAEPEDGETEERAGQGGETAALRLAAGSLPPKIRRAGTDGEPGDRAAPLRRAAGQAARAARFRGTAGERPEGGRALPELRSAAPDEPPPLQARRLDRVFERDARRYDGGFTLY